MNLELVVFIVIQNLCRVGGAGDKCVILFLKSDTAEPPFYKEDN